MAEAVKKGRNGAVRAEDWYLMKVADELDSPAADATEEKSNPAAARRIELHAPAQFRFLETEKARYKVCYSGRAAGKSWQYARALIKRAALQGLRVLCCREFQSSIADSVHKLLDDQISLLGLDNLFDVRTTSIRCRDTGSEFLFKGLRRNIREIKSLEGIDVAWVEEAEAVSRESWRLLLSTVRREDSEIWVSYNPFEETDPTHEMFALNPDRLDGKAIVRHVSWRDNPYLSQTILRRIKQLQSTDPDLFAHEYDGECLTRTDAQILAGKWHVNTFEPADSWNGPYYGLDFGFSNDPTALVQLYVHNNILYVRREAGGVGIPNSKLDETLFRQIPGAAEHRVRADASRPETINYLSEECGLDVVAAARWNGSVEDGIAHMRSYDAIVVHPSCTEVARECRLYRYKVDHLSGDIMRKVVDRHNHYLDACRYALEPLIQYVEQPTISATWGS